MVDHSSIVDGIGSSRGHTEAQLGKWRSAQRSTKADGQEVEPEGPDRTDRASGRVILRHARDDDADELESFDVGDSTEWLDEVSAIISGLIAWRSEPSAASYDRRVFVAVQDGQIVGVTAHECVVTARDRVWSRYRYLMVTAVRADQQRTGFARWLVESVIGEMRSMGCESVECLVHPANRPSIAFSRAVFPEADETQPPEDAPYVSFLLDL
jgi:GNAT superfamily N-acetyltransferase